jgi:hypothetical protein
MAWVAWDLAKRVRTPRQGEKNIQWVPLKCTCVSFKIQAPTTKAWKILEEPEIIWLKRLDNCCVVEVATQVSQDHDKNPCSCDNNHITTLLWSSKIMMKDQHPRSTHKLNQIRKNSFFKRIFLFQNFVSVDTTQSEIQQASILKSCLIDSHFRDMSS